MNQNTLLDMVSAPTNEWTRGHLLKIINLFHDTIHSKASLGLSENEYNKTIRELIDFIKMEMEDPFDNERTYRNTECQQDLISIAKKMKLE
ncbi:hypothetical protein SDC9_169141 [bioreactor metagenome]|uniref:Uncharacterized protein n=1 Tax=bioreactor metagenome TaxID=1076179 RepID=A0A645G4G2_9ZZZZ